MRSDGLTNGTRGMVPCLALAGFVLASGPVSVGSTSTGSGAPAMPTLSIDDVTRTEGQSGTTDFTFTVKLSAASTSQVKVKYATVNASAQAGSDYGAASGILTFDPGQISKLVRIVVNDDTFLEPNETFRVNLSAPTGAVLGDAQGLGTILNDDGPMLRIDDVIRSEGQTATTAFTFRVTLRPTSKSRVTVQYATADGSAQAGSDYTPAWRTLIFNPGQSIKTLTVSVRGDTLYESDETFHVNLSAPSGATLFDGQGLGTILNDDGLTLRRLNDTGITRCATRSQSGLNCPVSGFPGQDAQYGRDHTDNDPSDAHAGFSFTKLAANGNPLPATATSWSCVRDNVTGLVWEIKTKSGLRRWSNSYTWYNPDPRTNGGFAGIPNGGRCAGSACDTYAFVQAVNSQGLCGKKDWRLPTRFELASIASGAHHEPAIDTNWFPESQATLWSSSSYASNSLNAWTVAFYSDAQGSSLDKGYRFAVRLVRGGQ